MIAKFVIASGAAIMLTAAAAAAQTASPSPAPTPLPTPIAFSARAHVNLAVTVQGTSYTATTQLGIAQRDRQTRIDLLSFQSNSVPMTFSGVTFVIDRIANTLSVWNAKTKTYYVQTIVPRATASPSPSASATPTPTPAPARPVAHRSMFADLDVFAIGVKLTGHTTTVGLPTTGLIANFDTRKKGTTATTHVVITTQLADDFAAFPMTIEATFDPGQPTFKGSLGYVVDTFTRGTPPETRFDIPAGYAEGKSLLNVILGRPASP